MATARESSWSWPETLCISICTESMELATSSCGGPCPLERTVTIGTLVDARCSDVPAI